MSHCDRKKWLVTTIAGGRLKGELRYPILWTQWQTVSVRITHFERISMPQLCDVDALNTYVL